jgi:CheY-like chemotaxis protein
VSQILRNFISNALKFTPRGQVRVSAALDAARQEVVFAVADTGIGIVPEDQDRIFEEFAQAEHPIQQRTKGTGLGLPLARKLAELLGGSVNVQSTLERGSVFSAIIPLVYGGQTPVSAESQRLRTQAAVTATSEEPSHKVMIVDDDEAARYVLKRLLTETPYTVIEAASGSEGLRRAREDQPQVIFLDLRMPEMSGFEALERLKSDPMTRDIPIIVITSKLVENEERRLLDGKVVTVLSKAVASREALIGSIRQALSHTRPTQNEPGGVPQHG